MDTYLEQVIDYLLSQSWQIAILTFVVAFITFLLRHRSAHVRYLLWLIVLIKCLVPPLYSVPVSVLPQELLAGGSSVSEYSDVDKTDTDIIAALANDPQVSDVTVPAAEKTSPVNSSMTNTESPEVEVQPAFTQEAGQNATAEEVRYTSILTGLSIRHMLGITWLTGMCAYLALNVLKALGTRRWLRQSREPLQADLQAKVGNFFLARGFKRLPKIWVIDDVNQPFVWGLFRGSVYVPPDLLNGDSLERQRSVLGHEFGHILRFDAGVSVLQVIAQAVFWFHPLVWWANLRLRRERERCCDEMAVSALNASPKDYSRAIVETLTLNRGSARRVPSLAVVGPASDLEKRIRAILRPGRRFHKRPGLLVAFAVLLIAVLTVPTGLVLSAAADREAGETHEVTANEEETEREQDRPDEPVEVIGGTRPSYHQDAEWRTLETKVRTLRHQIATSNLKPKHPGMMRMLEDLQFLKESLRLREMQLDQQHMVEAPFLSAKEVLDRMVHTYSSCKSYRDKGVVVGSTRRKSFTTAFVRPDRFRFEGLEEGSRQRPCIVWRNRDSVRRWRDPERGAESRESLSLGIAGAVGGFGPCAHTVPRLLLPDEIDGRSLADLTDLERLDDEETDGIPCYKIRGRFFRDRMRTLWIDKRSYLIRKMLDASEYAGSIAARMTTYDPRIDIEVEAADLELNLPPDTEPSGTGVSEPELSSLIGKAAPTFTLRNLEGSQVSLSDFRGRAVLLHFWATWVGPCRQAIPYLNALHQKYKDQGLVLIGLTNEEDHDEVNRFAEKQMDYSVLSDAREQFKEYNVRSIPMTFYIDRDGIVRDYQVGFRPGSEKEMEQKVIGLLANRLPGT